MRHRGDRPRQVPWQVALSRQGPWHNLMQNHTMTKRTRGVFTCVAARWPCDLDLASLQGRWQEVMLLQCALSRVAAWRCALLWTCLSSGLEDMPSSWLHQLIPSLPPKDKLALFQTCRQLSQMVVVSSPLTCFQLHGSLEWKHGRWVREQKPYIYLPVYFLLSASSWCHSNMYCRATAWIIIVGAIYFTHINALMYLLMLLLARRRAGRIVSILNGSHNLKVKLMGTLPIPRQLYCQITVLAIHGHDISWGPGEYIHRCRWEDLAALHQLTLDNVSGRTLQQLSSALQTGHLKQLRKLSLFPHGVVEADYRCDVWYLKETTAIKLGHSLTHLATNCPQLWVRLHNFTALQSVEIGPGQLQTQPEKQRYSQLSADVLRQLCEHPTLRTVTLRACTLEDPWGHDSNAQYSCNCKTLIMDGTHPQVLANLTLTGLHEVRFVSGLPHCQQGDVQQLRRLLTAHGSIVSCGSARFSLHSELSTEAFQLLNHFNSVRTLRLLGPLVCLPNQSPELWALMPDSVTCLELWQVSHPIEKRFWRHMPHSISSIWLNGCDVQSTKLARLLATAPAHVRTIGLTPRSKEELQQWEDAAIKSHAAGHVLVDF